MLFDASLNGWARRRGAPARRSREGQFSQACCCSVHDHKHAMRDSIAMPMSMSLARPHLSRGARELSSES